MAKLRLTLVGSLRFDREGGVVIVLEWHRYGVSIALIMAN